MKAGPVPPGGVAPGPGCGGAGESGGGPGSSRDFPRLREIIERARLVASRERARVGLVHPCDALALQAARLIRDEGVAQPLLVGNRRLIEAAAEQAGVDARDFEIAETDAAAPAAASRAVELARDGTLRALMKGSLHTDELMSAVVHRETGLRSSRRISHAFVFDLPRYHKLLALADCVVNITPDLKSKLDILGNALDLLRRIGVTRPSAAVVAAVETVNPAIAATLDAQELVRLGREGRWGDADIEGPLGFDNAFSAQAARTKRIESVHAGDFDLMIVPDLNAGNMLYKSFVYVGGGECAGLVLGARVPIVLTSRADSLTARVASVALAALATREDAAQP
ncbi:MAG: bifunctional enoyl-CoA hydratase/phosphate acetyltransferase [Betaproteobacteria bacterium]|nr:bifunctional enoyl-CoA hydratase/phosphate acetyltransferase [Betaproteobacteria bacterium]MBU6511863.1 bifunctional enoyl-CoA hydratase/phosphate acetyltransferase [Betaproteobacteria bacterium]MDE1954908.1 bifunctional enoyl-CoA hydratase/phosphate acetyltransferase [Betaproteobacteria bacterium]MDE2152297.1 bifunctional enoyl-CoA hydratase/phosphate acetyltransferase [Betaproteobacteria bacterium]